MSRLRQLMIDDMKLAGVSAATHAIYINGVRGLAAHYRRSPDELSEEEVRAYLITLMPVQANRRDAPAPVQAQGSTAAWHRATPERHPWAPL
jgi:hypothetical protein